MRNPIVDLKLTWSVVYNLVLKTSRVYMLLGLFAIFLFVLQWLFNIDQLVEIVFGDNPLSIGERIDFLADGFVNIFRFADDFVPISMILIALVQAITLTLLISFRSLKRLKSSQGASLGLGFLGIGCVACGGSILTPILGLVATNVSVSLAESISTILLGVALVLSYASMNKVAFLVAKTMPKKR